MKKFFAIAFVCLFAANAHATKARVGSLLGATHLVDSQTIFTQPNHINDLGQYFTLELGPTADGATEPKAEGGMFRKMDDSVFGLYLGHHDPYQAIGRTTALPTTYQLQTNPVHVFYGRNNWGAHLGLSNTDKKTTAVSETTLYGGFGMDMGDLEWAANLELIANAKKGTGATESKYTGAPVISALAEYEMGTNFLYGMLGYSQIKSEPTGAASTTTKDTGLTLGWTDRTFKTQGSDFYHGIALTYADRDTEGRKATTMALPIYAGVEYTMNDWATFRGSVQQNFLLGSTKNDIPPSTSSETDTIANNTTVAAGLGFKYKSLAMDGTLSAATSGDVNGTAFLAKAGLLYNF